MTEISCYRIGIIGLGFVGNAVYQAMIKRHIQVAIYDKFKYPENSLDQLFKTNLIFMCLPTPYHDETQTYDISALNEVCQALSEAKYQGIVLIKSTVLPSTCQKLADEYQLKIIHNPEFLTARTAVIDFENQKQVVLGLTTQCQTYEEAEIHIFYQIYFPEAKISATTSGNSEAMKIFCNSFYAVKVQIFNEFYVLAQQMGLDYQIICQLMLNNGWINPMHTKVPGPDGQLSYGGNCFVKDTQALLGQMMQLKTPRRVLEACIMEQKEMRPSASSASSTSSVQSTTSIPSAPSAPNVPNTTSTQNS